MITSQLRLTLLLGAAALGTLATTTEAAPVADRTNRCYAIRIEGVGGKPASPKQRRRRASFSSNQVLDLQFEVWLHSSYAGPPVEVKLYTPKGHLYQTLKAVPEAASTDESASEDGRAARRHRSRSGSRYKVMSARLPVAGTHITNHSLFGRWRAEAFMSGSNEPCGKALSFEIAP